jgi:hypothetical protein
MSFFLAWLQVLTLTLRAQPFEVMITGEKKEEFRLKGKWIESRLINTTTGENKEYDLVEFVNGYGKDRPRFTVSFTGYTLEEDGVRRSYSNGLEVDTRGKPTYVIHLGDDISSSYK